MHRSIGQVLKVQSLRSLIISNATNLTTEMGVKGTTFHETRTNQGHDVITAGGNEETHETFNSIDNEITAKPSGSSWARTRPAGPLAVAVKLQRTFHHDGRYPRDRRS